MCCGKSNFCLLWLKHRSSLLYYNKSSILLKLWLISHTLGSGVYCLGAIRIRCVWNTVEKEAILSLFVFQTRGFQPFTTSDSQAQSSHGSQQVGNDLAIKNTITVTTRHTTLAIGENLSSEAAKWTQEDLALSMQEAVQLAVQKLSQCLKLTLRPDKT